MFCASPVLLPALPLRIILSILKVIAGMFMEDTKLTCSGLALCLTTPVIPIQSSVFLKKLS